MTRLVLPERSPDGGSERLEAFSDAILAIAITLLVIGIRIPDTKGALLGAALRHLWPSYLAYVLSFCTIGFVWVSHHSMFRRVRDVDRPLLIFNLALMMFVAFLPFSTAVLARYSWGSSAAGASTAAELYSLNMLLIGLAFTGLWIYLSLHESLRGRREARRPQAHDPAVDAPFDLVRAHRGAGIRERHVVLRHLGARHAVRRLRAGGAQDPRLVGWRRVRRRSERGDGR